MATFEIVDYDVLLHDERTASRTGGCAWGGVDTCPQRAVFSVVSPGYRYATCSQHLGGVVASVLKVEPHC